MPGSRLLGLLCTLQLAPQTPSLLQSLSSFVRLQASARVPPCHRPALTLDLLLQLASGGRFGRCLPAADQTFIVISDSVMKQLDGLKGVPECRVAVRKFLKEGLESMGSAGEGERAAVGNTAWAYSRGVGAGYNIRCVATPANVVRALRMARIFPISLTPRPGLSSPAMQVTTS